MEETITNPATFEIVKVFIGIGTGLSIKIMYDWFSDNRKYVTKDECKKNMDGCPSMANFKQDFMGHKGTMNQKLKQVEGQILEQHITYKKTAEDISTIKSNLAVVSAWVEREQR